MKAEWRIVLRNVLAVLFGTFILSIIGFYNGYPLVYSDTGTYIYSGFDLFVPKDRPLPYGLLIRGLSFKHSLWYVVLFQNFLTATLIFEVFRSFGRRSFLPSYILTMVLLTAFTGVAWYSNQIMPDLFAPILILCLFLLAFRKNSWAGTLLLSIIYLLAAVSHFSHLMIGSLMLLGILIAKLFFDRYGEGTGIRLPLRKGIAVAALVLSGWLVLPLINYAVASEFVLSKGSHVFLMASLNDRGILKRYLDENCQKEKLRGSKLCEYKDELPKTIDGFIWSDFLGKVGGWKKSKDEFNMIIEDVLSSPGYLREFSFRSFQYGVVQLAHNDIGTGLTPYTEGSPPHQQVEWRFKNEENNYLNSRQNKWEGEELQFEELSMFHSFLLLLCTGTFGALLFSPLRRRIEPSLWLFLGFVLLGIIVNSFVTAGLSSPYSRYQARVVWLFPLAFFLIAHFHLRIPVESFFAPSQVQDREEGDK